MASTFKHDRKVPDKSNRVEDDEEDDPVERMIKKTGCLEKHYAVQECMADEQDWRKCQQSVSEFKNCMANYQRSQAQQQQK